MTMPASKRALVTGASGGLGRAIAQRLARDGLHVIVHANRRLDAAQALADELVAAGMRCVHVRPSADDPAWSCAVLVR